MDTAGRDTHDPAAGAGRAEAGTTGPARDTGDPWHDFLAPRDGAAFLSGWLAIAADRIADAQSAVLFLRGAGGRLGPAASWRMEDSPPEPVTRLAEATLARGEPVIDGEGDMPRLGYPIDQDGAVQAVLVLMLARPPGRDMRGLMRELHWASGWIEARLWQGRAGQGGRATASARLVLDLLAAADGHARFDGAALALVNAIPELTGFDRAALGMVRGGRVRLEALSRAATFQRKADRVRAYEAAMDEAMAQADVIAWPARPDGAQPIDLAHRGLADMLGAGALVSAPLLVRGVPVGVLLLEKGRAADETVTLDAAAVEELRLAAAAVAPVLKLKHEERRWISGRGRAWGARAATAVLGRRPAIAAAVLVGAILLVLPFLLPADLRVRADATLQGAEQQVAVAPIDGFVAQSLVRAGATVNRGDVLARLDDRDLLLELAGQQARVDQARQTLREALAKGDRAGAAVAAADLAEAAAAADLAQGRLDRLGIVAPIDGLVVSGDLSQRIGAPVSRGEVLFEVARPDDYRLMIEVSEYDLSLVGPDQTGRVVFAGLSGLSVPFRVVAIAQVSDPSEGENRFRVEADSTTPDPSLRPGLQGIAKIDAGRSSLAWAWMRGTTARLRLLLWRVTP